MLSFQFPAKNAFFLPPESGMVQDLLLSQRAQLQKKQNVALKKSIHTPAINQKQFNLVSPRQLKVSKIEQNHLIQGPMHSKSLSSDQQFVKSARQNQSLNNQSQPSFLYLQKNKKENQKRKAIHSPLVSMHVEMPMKKEQKPIKYEYDEVREHSNHDIKDQNVKESLKSQSSQSSQQSEQSEQSQKNQIKHLLTTNEKDQNSPQLEQRQSFTSEQESQGISVKNKLRKAVQKSSTLSLHKKSIFNLIISPEFGIAHEVERLHLQQKFEAGNQILGNIQFQLKKSQKKTKRQYESEDWMNQIQNISQMKFQTSLVAFQRKIQMIKHSSQSIKANQQSFSLIPKSIRKSAQIPYFDQQTSSPQPRIKLTISFEQKDTTFEFNKPRYSISNLLQNTIVEDPVLLLTRKKLEPTARFSKSSTNIRTSICSVPKEELDQESLNNLHLNQEFNKANLYVRMYYQNRLYKLPKKSMYTTQNLTEIDLDSNDKTQRVFRECESSDTKVLKTEQFSLYFFPCTQIQKYCLIYDNVYQDFIQEEERDSVITSSESESNTSLEKLLESPNSYTSNQTNKNRLEDKQQFLIKSQNLIQAKPPVQPKDVEPTFIFDLFQNTKQLSTGQLILIKKIRKGFKMPIEIMPIISTLDQETKNELLTFKINPQPEISNNQIFTDTDSISIQQMEKYQKSKELRQITLVGLEARYEHILNGRYQGFTKMIDVEHQEQLPLQIQSPPQLSLSGQQSSQQQQSTELVITNKQQLKNMKNLYKSQKVLIKKDTLQKKNKGQNSPDHSSGNLSKPQTLQSNQFTNQFVTQTSTQFLTKPTNTSQHSVFRVLSAKQIDLDHPELSPQSSFHSLKSGQDSPQTTTGQPAVEIKKSSRNLDEQVEKKVAQVEVQKQEKSSNSSMYQFSIRMRTHAREQARRAKLEQTEIIKLAIQDNNFIEFMENFILLPQSQIDFRLENGDSYLIIASQAGCKEIVKELIKRGADVNACNDDGNTALHLALAYGQNTIADMLIESGAHTNILNNQGKNAWTV